MEAVTLDLPQSLDISMISSYHKETSSLISELTDNTTLTFNAQALSRIDTAGFQLLAALVVDLTSRKIGINWQNIPDELVDNAQYLGLFEFLKLD